MANLDIQAIGSWAAQSGYHAYCPRALRAKRPWTMRVFGCNPGGRVDNARWQLCWAIWVARLLSTGASREAPVDNECFSKRQQEFLIYRPLGAGLGNLGTWSWVPRYLGWRWQILIYRPLGAGQDFLSPPSLGTQVQVSRLPSRMKTLFGVHAQELKQIEAN